MTLGLNEVRADNLPRISRRLSALAAAGWIATAALGLALTGGPELVPDDALRLPPASRGSVVVEYVRTPPTGPDIPRCAEDETYLKGAGNFTNGRWSRYVCMHPDNLEGIAR